MLRQGEFFMKIQIARVVAALGLLVLPLTSLTLAQTQDEAVTPAAATFCISTAGGFGNGGTTFVAPTFTVPAKNKCAAWSGWTKTASTVILNTSGAACLSTSGKTLTVSVFSIDPAFFGTTAVTDYIELTRASASGSFTGGTDQGQFAGTAAQLTCTSSLLSLPDSHD
jgi:hypothetical protein